MRLEVTRRSDLAVRAVNALETAQGQFRAKDLAHTLGTTVAFVPQMLNPLVSQGPLRSDPGPNGGLLGHRAERDRGDRGSRAAASSSTARAGPTGPARSTNRGRSAATAFSTPSPRPRSRSSVSFMGEAHTKGANQ